MKFHLFQYAACLLLSSAGVLSAATFPGEYTHNSGIANLPRLTASTLTINAGRLILDSKVQPRDPAGTSVINSLVIRNLNNDSFSPAATLDITNNALIIDYDRTYSLDSIRRLIQSGVETGNGITSTLSSQSTRLAYVDNSVTNLPSFGHVRVDSSSVLIALTYAGDSNLDSVVNIQDLYNLAIHWKSPGIWTSGDFNYDGMIDALDLQLLAANWHAGVGTATVDPGLDDLFMAVVTSLENVPEPASLAGLCILACGAMRIRSRR